MRRALVSLAAISLVFASANPVSGQTDEERVLAAVQRLFDAMEAGDSAAASSVLHKDARFVVIDSRDGKPPHGITYAADFLSSVGDSGGSWKERIWDPEVRVDGDMASVWAPYDFRLDDRLSHCGVDSFALVRTSAGWKIISIVYTARGCKGPTSP